MASRATQGTRRMSIGGKDAKLRPWAATEGLLRTIFSLSRPAALPETELHFCRCPPRNPTRSQPKRIPTTHEEIRTERSQAPLSPRKGTPARDTGSPSRYAHLRRGAERGAAH